MCADAVRRKETPFPKSGFNDQQWRYPSAEGIPSHGRFHPGSSGTWDCWQDGSWQGLSPYLWADGYIICSTIRMKVSPCDSTDPQWSQKTQNMILYYPTVQSWVIHILYLELPRIFGHHLPTICHHIPIYLHLFHPLSNDSSTAGDGILTPVKLDPPISIQSKSTVTIYLSIHLSI